MKSILMALAAASAVASGAAAAAMVQVGHDATAIAGVQHYARWDDRLAYIDEREARIGARIQQGLQNGRITHREARRLYRDLHAIETKEQAFKSDGWLNRRELVELNGDLDRLAWNVRDQSRDGERRY